MIILWQINISMVFWHKLSLPWYSFSPVRTKNKSIHIIYYTNIHIQACVTLDYISQEMTNCVSWSMRNQPCIGYSTYSTNLSGRVWETPEAVGRGIQNGPSWQWLNTHLFPFLTFTFIEWVHTFKSSLPLWRY